jgi:flagellar biosynthesis/type III secretory pathway protein FliH
MNAAQLVKRVVLDAQDEAARLLAAAEEQAASIVATAEKRAEHALLDAERRGLEQGVAQAAARALHIAKDAARVDTHALPRVIEIARMLSERMLGRAIELQPALLGELAFAALKEARAGHAVQFRCHPADVPVIEAAFTSTGLGTTAVDVVADPELGSGDFKLRSAAGVLEASLGGRLDLLCRALLEAPRA